MVGPMRILTHSALLSVAAFSAVLCGCRNFEKPKYDVDDRRILLVPFRDLAVKHGHGFGESERGRRAVEAFRNWTEKNASPDFADRQTTEQVVRELREWPKDALTPMDWKKLTIGIDTDLVLLGEIRKLRTTDPKSVGFYKGEIVGGYFLIDTRTGREAYRSTEIKLEYPPPKNVDIPITQFGAEPEEIVQGLLKALGEKVGKDLYGYYSERD